jgi:hypothetical protein
LDQLDLWKFSGLVGGNSPLEFSLEFRASPPLDSGVFSEELDLKASLAFGTFVTVFQAEVYTIMACSDYWLRECMTRKTVCICSDSRAAVSSKLVFQCLNSLQGLSIHSKAQLFWVPGHCSIIGNEVADSLAVMGSKSSFCGPEPCLPVPRSLMTRVKKEWLSGNHLSYWNLVSV